AAVDREMHRRLARRPLFLVDRFAVEIDLDEIFRRQKAERRVLAGDQQAVFPQPAADVSAPARDQPPLEEQLAPANELRAFHAPPSLKSDHGMTSFSTG